MPKKKKTKAVPAAKGRGTKVERKAVRRATAEAGRGPDYPRRTDRAFPGEGKRRKGPRR